MALLMPIIVGLLFAVSLYMLLRRHVFSLLIGLVTLAHAVNLLLLSTGGLTRRSVPILPESGDTVATADPLPQALILTAIVIGLGLLTFVLTLIYRLASEQHTPDLDEARTSEGEDGA